MNKEKYLTVGWNNILTLGLGMLLLIYVFIVLFTSLISDQAGFIGLVVFGVSY